jgi:hypothetical protein
MDRLSGWGIKTGLEFSAFIPDRLTKVSFMSGAFSMEAPYFIQIG